MKNLPGIKHLVFLLFSFIAFVQTHANPVLPAIFGDSMVFQQKFMTPVWGWADKGERIVVTGSWPGAKPVSAVADNKGNWKVKIQTPAAGGPYQLTVSGKEKIIFKGVLIGEVWLCGGQSNMEMPMKGFGAEYIENSAEAIKNSANSKIRLFTVTKKIALAPENNVEGQWASAHPASVTDFSATGYFFGRELYDKLKIPIGLISSNWGGTVAEAWTDKATLHTLKDFDQALNRITSLESKRDSILAATAPLQAKWSADSAIINHENSIGITDGSWKEMNLPTMWENAGMPDFDGIVWFVKEVEFPASFAQKNLVLSLGPIDDGDITFVNGVEVGRMPNAGFYATERNYEIPLPMVNIGKNIIAIRVTDMGGGGGIYGEAAKMKVYPKGEENNAVSIAGNWRYKVDVVKPVLESGNNSNMPSVLFNGMMAPLAPYGVKGAIWYQGESNVGRAEQYLKLFPAMINSWRKAFNNPAMSFYYVQIAPFKYGGDGRASAALRNAQRLSLKTPNTGMVVTSDINKLSTIHPPNKADVGKRLAYWALAKNYGQTSIEYSGPLYKSVVFKNHTAIVNFTNAKGLKVKGEAIGGFELAGADKIFHPATAEIVGNTMVVRSSSVSLPKYVRYNWHDTETAEFFNSAGLPASTFTSE